jgi:hypothetical protein
MAAVAARDQVGILPGNQIDIAGGIQRNIFPGLKLATNYSDIPAVCRVAFTGGGDGEVIANGETTTGNRVALFMGNMAAVTVW